VLITSIEAFASEYVTLVRIRTDDGDEGRGIEVNSEWIALSDYRISYMGSRF